MRLSATMETINVHRHGRLRSRKFSSLKTIRCSSPGLRAFCLRAFCLRAF